MTRRGKRYRSPTMSVSVPDDVTRPSIDPWWTEEDQLCPRLELDSKAARTLSGYVLINADLEFAEECLNLLHQLAKTGGQETIQRSLWIAAIVTYAKCYRSASGRRTTLTWKREWRSRHAQKTRTHREMMRLRDEYFSHGGGLWYESAPIMAALNPEGSKKGVAAIYCPIMYKVSVQSCTVESYLDLLRFVRGEVGKQVEGLQRSLLAQLRNSSIEPLYEAASYPPRTKDSPV